MDVALILAKKNSSGLPGKNLLKWRGVTLLEHTINHLRKTNLYKNIYISTNCQKIAKISEGLNCKIIIRNDELTKNENYVKSVHHACNIIKKFNTLTIPMVVQPVREDKIFQKMLKILKKRNVDSVVTVEEFNSSTAWIYQILGRKIKKLQFINYKNEIGRRNDLVILNNAVVAFNYSSWKKNESITPWPYLGKNIYYIKQNFINKNFKVDINDFEDKKWFYKITQLLKWKRLY